MKNIILIIVLSISNIMFGQVQYGNNPNTGKYIQTEDAKIYYEVYGEGEPLLLIHGSLFGYISEFKHILPELSKKYKVIAVALRGHGKSEIGNQDFRFSLFAKDIIQVLNAEGIDKTNIVGFSAGAITAICLTTDYPDRVLKTVSIAGALSAMDTKNFNKEDVKDTGERFVNQFKGFVDFRKKLMPEPDRFVEFYEKLKALDNTTWVNEVAASQITTPVLIVGGDRDNFFPVKAFLRMYSVIPNASLSIIPKSGHVDVLKNNKVYTNYVLPFLKEN